MPLVVPGINNVNNSSGCNGGVAANTQEWMNKLAGKKLGDGHNETTFATADLPKGARVIWPGQMVTKDFRPNRLNVHLAEDGTVSHVNHQ